MTSTDELVAYVTVVKCGNFTAASKQLGLSKQLMSRRILQLEERLGARLLIRTTRKLSTTETGQAFYVRAQQILQQLQEAEQEVSNQADELRGLIRLAAPLSYATMRLSQAIHQFMLLYPLVEVWVEADNRLVDVVGEGYDMVIRITNQPEEGMVVKTLEPSPMVYTCSPAYAKQFGVPASPSEVKQHHCLTHRSSEWVFVEQQELLKMHIHPRVKSNHGEVLRNAALAGLGITCLPAFYTEDDIRAGRLVEILAPYRYESAAVYLMTPYHKQTSRLIRAFSEHLLAWFASNARPQALKPTPT